MEDQSKSKEVMKNCNTPLDLDFLRAYIDLLDRNIISTLNFRFSIVEKISNIKIKNDIPIYDSGREDEILNKIRDILGLLGKSAPEEAILNIFRTIFEESRKFQENLQKSP